MRRFVVLPRWAQETLALWVLHTYAFELRDVTAYLGIESPEKRCGKTTLLTVLTELVNRPVIAANISPPALFRVIEQTRPTLLIDEADTFLSAKDELRGILNSGYTRKTAYVLRVFRGPASRRLGPSPIVRFSCWCPKVLAAIGRLPETLADRCIMLRMQRKTPGEQCERLRNLDANHLRRRCARFVLDHRADIASVHPTLPAGLNDRAADIWDRCWPWRNWREGRGPSTPAKPLSLSPPRPPKTAPRQRSSWIFPSSLPPPIPTDCSAAR